MDAELSVVLAELAAETGWLAEGESTYVEHHWNLHHLERPQALRSPDEFAGGPDLTIWCTQCSDLSPGQQRKLVDQWVQTLPTLQGVRRLWFISRVPQPLFDAACRIGGLTELWIKWSGVQSLDAVAGLRRLECLHLGDSASLQTLAPLSAMPQLRWLWLGGVTKIPDLEPLAVLVALQGLCVTGAESKALVVPSFQPLTALRSLRPVCDVQALARHVLHFGSLQREAGRATR